MPDCAGWVPGLVSVKTMAVAPPSTMEAAPKVFATLGCTGVTTRHCAVEVLVALVVVTLAAALVKVAAGQLAFTWPARLASPATVTVQLAVPEAIVIPVSPESTCVPALYAAVAGPAQPAE